MAKEEQQHGGTRAEDEGWGTLEELLLACAVNRHGTKSWDSIAMEVQNRTSIFPSRLTSQHCIEKFNDLKRRFKPHRNDTAAASVVPIIDELRKIRVEELRREVQRRDVSISSLESKVKKLEEERDRSVKEETDLVGEKKSSKDTVPRKTAAGEESGDERENRSFNESNSTDQQKAETTTARVQNDDVDDEPTPQPDPQIKIENEPVRSGSDPRSGRDWSCNGKSEDVEEEEDDDGNGKIETDNKKKEPGLKLSQTTGGLGESNELGESVGESKREEKEKEKQNSDVQSSASLSLKTKKRRHRGGGGGGGSRGKVVNSSGDSGLGAASSSGDEPEGGDEVSPATKRVKAAAVKSELMSKLIETIRSHRLGSVFQQRLRSQETQKYKNLIRQHIDIQTIQSRLGKGVYSSSIHKFFRDLLLLFNNGVVFFRKNSPENTAACELRALVLKEMTKQLGKKQRKPETTRSERETKPPPPQQPTSFSKPTKSSSTIVVCAGKASSAKTAGNSAKTAGNSAKTAGNSVKTTASESVSKKGSSGDKKEKEVEEKPKAAANVKKIEGGGSFPRIEEKGIRKKRTKDQRSASSNGRNNSNKNAETKHKYGGNELSSHDALEMKVEKKGNNNNSNNNNNNNTTSKRQGAASFLKRMKQNSPSHATGNEDGDGSSSSSSSEEEVEVEEEEISKNIKAKEDSKAKKGIRNKEEITERVTRSSRGRSAKEESARGKRAVGRPPKKESPKSTVKRGRENGGTDVGAGGGRARKRSRR